MAVAMKAFFRAPNRPTESREIFFRVVRSDNVCDAREERGEAGFEIFRIPRYLTCECSIDP